MRPQLLLPNPETSGQASPVLKSCPTGSALPLPCPSADVIKDDRDWGVKAHMAQGHIKCSSNKRLGDT